jgi:hypothetical protein
MTKPKSRTSAPQKQDVATFPPVVPNVRRADKAPPGRMFRAGYFVPKWPPGPDGGPFESYLDDNKPGRKSAAMQALALANRKALVGFARDNGRVQMPKSPNYLPPGDM